MDNEDSAASTGTAISAAVEKHELHSERESTPPTAPLSDQEKDIIDRQLTAPNLTIGYFSLFRYASTKDKLVMVVALISSIAAGAVMPLMTVSDMFPTLRPKNIRISFFKLPGILALSGYPQIFKYSRMHYRTNKLIQYRSSMVTSQEASPASQSTRLLPRSSSIKSTSSLCTIST